MHHKLTHLYIGVDLHKHQHTAVVINCWHEKKGELTFENKPSAFPQLVKLVKKLAKKEELTPVFGLEDVGGYGRALAIYLKDNGYMVKEVNSALSYAQRKSYPTTQKSDSWDAECVAQVLLNQLDTLPDANPQDIYWTIGQLVSRRNALVKNLSACKNQLHMQLNYQYPSYNKFFSEIDGKTALAFWSRFPAPHCLAGVTEEKLTEILLKASARACSTRKAREILALVEADGDTRREYQESRDFIIQSIVRDIKFKKEEIAEVEQAIGNVMKLLEYKLETMAGINLVTASALVAEIGDIRRFSSPDKLARFAGIAPVNYSSGGKGRNQKSRQGNRVLHGLFYTLAVQQVQTAKGSKMPRNPFFYEYYHRKLAEGKTKGQALICVMRRLVNIIYGMMKHKTAYVAPIVEQQKAG
ncbi:IS110 family RNA-guided transposase [Aneurinibacillus migulanus]|uniref:Transposase n=1 Tax=Aneurinibacillus migulanus TaxID=47500 RepID=A0A0D1XQI1_ANEMI|nr:IS110 family transposase [Aneurinibacillus migulanus]KIV56561.1 transposase [Aneurinibacillus migulanus]KON95320.1 transposase [Aneurinibacillus migulanus]MED0893734.1 IS110 family transposase [Aneurinibacillus migulanus]MED1617762.1 IS110 family transposase [Aneurinibacillus migulanus]SDI65939.1 Transposase [Aneurinibacillus migulanus]